MDGLAPSRDTASSHGGVDTLTAPARSGSRLAAPVAYQRPRRIGVTPQRLGSKQIVSYRGHRVITGPNRDYSRDRTVAGLILILIAGVVITVAIAGQTTAQSFTLHRLDREQNFLQAKIDTLTREVSAESSTAALTQRAAHLGMVIPGAPGLIGTGPNGVPVVLRQPESKGTQPVAALRAGLPPAPAAQPGVNPAAPAPAAPRPAPTLAAELPQLAPYSPNTPDTAAPALVPAIPQAAATQPPAPQPPVVPAPTASPVVSHGEALAPVEVPGLGGGQ